MITMAEARAALPGDTGAVGAALSALRPEPALQIRAQLFRAVNPAREVIADVHDRARGRGRPVEGVEGCDPVCLGWRDREPGADIVQRTGADPADPVLHRVQDRQKEVPPGPGSVAAEGNVHVSRAAL